MTGGLPVIAAGIRNPVAEPISVEVWGLGDPSLDFRAPKRVGAECAGEDGLVGGRELGASDQRLREP